MQALSMLFEVNVPDDHILLTFHLADLNIITTSTASTAASTAVTAGGNDNGTTTSTATTASYRQTNGTGGNDTTVAVLALVTKATIAHTGNTCQTATADMKDPTSITVLIGITQIGRRAAITLREDCSAASGIRTRRVVVANASYNGEKP